MDSASLPVLSSLVAARNRQILRRLRRRRRRNTRFDKSIEGVDHRQASDALAKQNRPTALTSGFGGRPIGPQELVGL